VENKRRLGQGLTHPAGRIARMENVHPYKPSAHYFRRALRDSKCQAEAVAIGMHLVLELELKNDFIRSQGLIPPKWNIMQSEIEEKNWGAVVPFPISEQSDQGQTFFPLV
jgi:hypothetical protein